MPALISALKSEHTKRILRATGIRPAAVRRGRTPHYRMPVLQAAGGCLVLDRYRGPEIPEREWEETRSKAQALLSAIASVRDGKQRR